MVMHQEGIYGIYIHENVPRHFSMCMRDESRLDNGAKGARGHQNIAGSAHMTDSRCATGKKKKKILIFHLDNLAISPGALADGD